MGQFCTEQDHLLSPKTRHRHKKRLEGQCGWDGCKAEAGPRYHCPVHREAEAARQKARRQAAKQDGQKVAA